MLEKVRGRKAIVMPNAWHDSRFSESEIIHISPNNLNHKPLIDTPSRRILKIEP